MNLLTKHDRRVEFFLISTNAMTLEEEEEGSGFYYLLLDDS